MTVTGRGQQPRYGKPWFYGSLTRFRVIGIRENGSYYNGAIYGYDRDIIGILPYKSKIT